MSLTINLSPDTGSDKGNEGTPTQKKAPGGHPEGYLEAFAHIYRNFAQKLLADLEGKEPSKEMLDFPGVDSQIDENVLRHQARQMSRRHLHNPSANQLGLAFDLVKVINGGARNRGR